MRAATTTPVEPSGADLARFPGGGGLPRSCGGSASTLTLSRPAQCSLALRPAWPTAPQKGTFPGVLQTIRRLLIRPGCFRLERELPGGICTHGTSAPWQGTHNLTAERALRGIAVGRKNWNVIGSDAAGAVAAVIYSLIETCRLNGINPEAYLTDVIARIGRTRMRDLDTLLPFNWRPPDASNPADPGRMTILPHGAAAA